MSTSTNYRATFFAGNPGTKGRVSVHHAVEQRARAYGIAATKLHSLENLRGIPKGLNSSLHLRDIRREWNRFYRTTPNPSEGQFLDMATTIDDKYGHLFDPPVR
jgi:hypothetical protein